MAGDTAYDWLSFSLAAMSSSSARARTAPSESNRDECERHDGRGRDRDTRGREKEKSMSKASPSSKRTWQRALLTVLFLCGPIGTVVSFWLLPKEDGEGLSRRAAMGGSAPEHAANIEPRVSLGPVPEPAVEDLGDLGLSFVEYMSPPGHRAQAAQTSMSGEFYNFLREDLEYYWQDGSQRGVLSGYVKALGRSSTNSHQGHQFVFLVSRTKRRVGHATMRRNESIYVIEPDAADDETRASRDYRDVVERRHRLAEYYAAHGTHWLSVLGRPAPSLHMWPADAIGQVHTVESSHGFWRSDDGPSGEAAHLRLTVLSKAPDGPRVLYIPDLLSEHECEVRAAGRTPARETGRWAWLPCHELATGTHGRECGGDRSAGHRHRCPPPLPTA